MACASNPVCRCRDQCSKSLRWCVLLIRRACLLFYILIPSTKNSGVVTMLGSKALEQSLCPSTALVLSLTPRCPRNCRSVSGRPGCSRRTKTSTPFFEVLTDDALGQGSTVPTRGTCVALRSHLFRNSLSPFLGWQSKPISQGCGRLRWALGRGRVVLFGRRDRGVGTDSSP